MEKTIRKFLTIIYTENFLMPTVEKQIVKGIIKILDRVRKQLKVSEYIHLDDIDIKVVKPVYGQYIIYERFFTFNVTQNCSEKDLDNLISLYKLNPEQVVNYVDIRRID